ncbi:hypothetical protein FB451DRAFT_104841 [Mycena latifolia]|nr:hypothetical protein FB451DRAFT_104841 [Mycena latifolia]
MYRVAQNVELQRVSSKQIPLDLTVTPGTRHYELLNSNEPPQESDLGSIKLVSSKASMHLRCLDGEISRIRDHDLLKELEEERSAVSNFLAQNDSILSPLRRMPPEILGDIFLWTLPSLYDVLGGCGFDVGRSPWVLGHISSRWRAVALSTPSLWSLVAIDCAISSWCPLPMLETQIGRARNLKIHFYGDEKSDSLPQISIFRSLAEHSSSWEELSIGVTADLLPLLATVRDHIPSLFRLWIQWEISQSQTAEEPIDVFHTAPSLLDAGINNHYRHLFVPILLPSHQLTRYENDAPWTVHQGILKLARNLVEARLAIFDDESSPEYGDIIELPCLHRLYVSHRAILEHLRTPAL